VGVRFDEPLALLLIIPLFAFTLALYLRHDKSRRGAKKRVFLALRLTALALVASSLAGTMLVRKTRENAVIVLADLSDSARDVRGGISDAVKALFGAADVDTAIGLATFGHDTVYELPLLKSPDFTAFGTYPAAHHTDIAGALGMAAAMLPDDANRRIVLLTDGRQTVGDAAQAADALAAQGIRVDAVLFGAGVLEKEVQVSAVRTPELLYEGEEFELTVTVESASDADAVLRLYSEDTLRGERSVRLTKGVNTFAFQDAAVRAGVQSYTVEVEAEDDVITRNNRMHSYIKVTGEPVLLVVEGEDKGAHEFTRLISGSAQYKVTSPAAVPRTLDALRKYDGVVLINTDYYDFPEGFGGLLEQYVRKLGRGVFTSGGERSYALGGWTGTDLEKLLPVDMTVKNEAELPGVALMLLIDNSGSMGGTGTGDKLSMAKEAAARAVRALKSIDEVGVIAYSDTAAWVSRLVPGTQKGKVAGLISRIGPGGGTMMYEPMRLAYEELLKSGKKVKHIILLTDGQPADSGFETLTEKMRKNGITLTTVAIGADADKALLARLAADTDGRTYQAAVPSQLPNIMLKETFLAMGDYVNNVTFTPLVAKTSPVLAGIGGFTQLHGYIGTEIKDAASMVLCTDDGKPVYAEWQYGLGRAASFTSDLEGRWSAEFLSAEDGQKFVRNMVSRILPSEEDSGNGAVSVVKSQDKGLITVQSPFADAEYPTAATVISPDGGETELSLSLTGVGVYTGSFPLAQEGTYLVRVTQRDGDTLLISKEQALASSYSDEYDAFAPQSAAVETVCAKTGGKVFASAKDILGEKLEGARRYSHLAPVFLPLGLLLLLFDVALRRLRLDGLGRALARRKAAIGGVVGAAAQAAAEKLAKPQPEKARLAMHESGVSSGARFGAGKIGQARKNDASVPAGGKKSPPSPVGELIKAKEEKGRRRL